MMAETDARLWDILATWEGRFRQGEDIAAEELCRDCPELLDELKGHIQALKGMSWLLKPDQEDDLAADEPSLPFDFGEYTVQEKIGAGGMGQVFKALHRRMERTVALKLLPKVALAPPEAIQRFQQEVSSAARLTHPNIVTAFDAGEYSGTPFLAMEYVEGNDLFHQVQEHGRKFLELLPCLTHPCDGQPESLTDVRDKRGRPLPDSPRRRRFAC